MKASLLLAGALFSLVQLTSCTDSTTGISSTVNNDETELSINEYPSIDESKNANPYNKAIVLRSEFSGEGLYDIDTIIDDFTLTSSLDPDDSGNILSKINTTEDHRLTTDSRLTSVQYVGGGSSQMGCSKSPPANRRIVSDLNSNAGGDYIYLCYGFTPVADMIKDNIHGIQFIGYPWHESGEGWAFEDRGYYPVKNYKSSTGPLNMNQGMSTWYHRVRPNYNGSYYKTTNEVSNAIKAVGVYAGRYNIAMGKNILTTDGDYTFHWRIVTKDLNQYGGGDYVFIVALERVYLGSWMSYIWTGFV
ncbi:MAG: hypothetical protein OCC49_05365 [Fibrobacterales bacterium]